MGKMWGEGLQRDEERLLKSLSEDWLQSLDIKLGVWTVLFTLLESVSFYGGKVDLESKRQNMLI